MIIDIIAGTRPNFIKVASLIHAYENHDIKKKSRIRFIHTGQHFDKNMSETFFEDLELPNPDFNFDVRGGTHAVQTSNIMIKYEELLMMEMSDFCIVVGDVNSTMACALVAKKAGLKVVHVEAGIRSYDTKMPEEINRLVTDSITDYFFTTTQLASENLLLQGVSTELIHLVGNTMIDTLIRNQNKFRKPYFFDEINLNDKNYIVLTLHRPSNVDDKDNLYKIIDTIIQSTDVPIIFPIHPRTEKVLRNKYSKINRLTVIKPLSYLDFLYLIHHSKAIITDSGGITEEATFLNIPCMTLRTSTERPETVEIGSNVLVGDNPLDLISYLKDIEAEKWKKSSIPFFWDGETGKRIWDVLCRIICKNE